MNEKFYQLPAQKQQAIINAGFRVFSENTYKKSPVSEIAAAAGISKSLLFFYFQNKKDLYLFLWEKAAGITSEYLAQYRCYESSDFFEMIERGMAAKLHMMRQFPYMAQFAVKAFYEKDEAICVDIQKSYQAWFGKKALDILSMLDPDDFIPGLDLQMMYRDMYWAAEGYLFEMLQRGSLDAGQIELDFHRLLAFWKTIYLRKSDAKKEADHARNTD